MTESVSNQIAFNIMGFKCPYDISEELKRVYIKVDQDVVHSILKNS